MCDNFARGWCGTTGLLLANKNIQKKPYKWKEYIFKKKFLIEYQAALSIITAWFSTFKQIGFIYFNESPLKMMQNAVYFMLKAFFISC